MYCQLLEEAVKRVKNETVEKPKEVNIDINITGVLPKTYVDSERQRMDLYRRLSRATSTEMLEALAKDITDAFGPMPKSVQIMFGLAEIKIFARLWSIQSIITKSPDVIFTIDDMSKLGPLMGRGVGGAGSVRIADEKTVHLRLPASYLEPETLVNVLRNLLNPNAPKPEPKKPEPPKPQPSRLNPGASIRRRL
jgi:transcription-repair coupling factor (superfamily II helicase)